MDASEEKEEKIRKPRVFSIDDETYQALCKADKVSLDPTKGLENIVSMFLSLNGPIDFEQLQRERARNKAKDLFDLNS